MKFKIDKKDWFTIPNILCYIRILLVPLFMVLYLTAGDSVVQHYVATSLIFVAGFTDFLDGQIARRCNQITDLGKFIDPLGDKLMQFAIAIVLVIHYDWMWVLLSIFIFKELFMLVCDIILFTRNVKLSGAKWFGKLSTFVFYVVMGVLLVLDCPSIAFANKETICTILMAVSAFFLLLSFVLYIPVFINLFKVAFGKKKEQTNSKDIESL